MENLELETLNLFEKSPFELLQNRRRRPLKSRTFDTFLRIVSECHLHFYNQEQVATVQSDRSEESNDLSIQGDRLVESNDMGTEDGLAREKSLVREDREGGLVENNDLWMEDGSACENSLINEDREDDWLVEKNDFGMEDELERENLLVNEDREGDLLVENNDSQPEDGLVCENLVVDENREIMSSQGQGLIGDHMDEDGLDFVDNIKSNDQGHVDTPVSASPMVSSSLQKTVEGIEVGEISEVSGVYEKSSDLIHEDVVPLEKNSEDKGEVSGDIVYKGFRPNALQRGPAKDNQYFDLDKNGVSIASTALNVEKGNDNRNLVNNRIQVCYGDTAEGDREDQKDSRLEFRRNKRRCSPKETNIQASCPKEISLSDGSTGKNAVENRCSASTEKVGDQDRRKRKRGGYTKEAKDKKKKKERMNRAKTNRDLGVKKLKLTPVAKLKTVIYCRHFLKGRCREGENCKYSHDTVPLTKSRPCCHFARHACMKGDDCPFDHQLSKYPCNSFLSQGFCFRRSSCLFSHKVAVKEGSSLASDTCNLDSRSVSVKENSLLKNHVNPNSTGNQISSTNLCSSRVSSFKNDKKNGEETALQPAGQAPKGISFILHENVPIGNMSKDVQGALSVKADNGAKVDQQTFSSASNGVESLNKNTLRTPVVPRGLNFLSFGNAPSGSVNTMKSNFTLVSNGEIGKSSLSSPNKGVQAGSSSKTIVRGKVDCQTGHSASNIVQNMNEAEKRTPARTPRGLGFLSVGNLLDGSSNRKQAGSNLNEINTVLSTVTNNECASNKLQTPNPVLPPVSSSLPSHDRSLGKQIDQSKSSFQGSLFSNSPSSVQRAFQSTLALAAKFESKMKNNHSYDFPIVRTDLSKKGSSFHNKFTKPSTIGYFIRC